MMVHPTATHRANLPAQEPVTVRIADFYLCYWREDAALQHILTDPRAEIVDASAATALWHEGDVDASTLWNIPEIDTLTRLFLHYWRHDLEFDYVDVGAHCGITSFPRAIFIRRCNRRNRVIAFEPGRTFELLARGVSLNRLQDVMTTVQAAVTNISGPVAFHILEEHTPGSSLLESAVDVSADRVSHTVVKGVTLDEFAREAGFARNLICKIDAEGADLKVIEGLCQRVEAGYVSIQFEFTPRLIDSYAEPVQRLAELNEKFWLLDMSHRTSCHAMGSDRAALSAFVQSVRDSQSQYTDILLLPRKLPAVEELARMLMRGAPEAGDAAENRACGAAEHEPGGTRANTSGVEADLASMRKAVSAAEAALAETREKLAAAEAELAQIRGSRSWRATGPFRWIYSRLHR